MKNLRFLSIFVFIVALSVSANAQQANNVDVTATVSTAFNITTNTAVNFGTVDGGSNAILGTNLGSNTNVTGGSTGELAFDGLVNGATLLVSWNTDAVLALSGTPAETMSFTPALYFTTGSTALGTPAGTAVVLTGTTGSIEIGGTLGSSGAASGSYSTTNTGGTVFSISLDYQ